MKLEHLALFAKLQHHPSLNKACDQLYISHQALSKMIQTLETELNAQLIKRSTKGFSFTAEGELLCQTATELTALLDDTKKALTVSYMEQHCQELVLYTDSFTAGTILPQFLPTMHITYPSLSVRLEKIPSLPYRADYQTHCDEAYATYLNRLQTQKNALCIFSFFHQLPIQPVSFQETAFLPTPLPAEKSNIITKPIVTTEIKLISIYADRPQTKQTSTLTINERNYGSHNALTEYLSQYFSVFYPVQSQNQCIKALQKNSYTIDVASNLKTLLPELCAHSFQPPIGFTTYTFISAQSSEAIRLFEHLLHNYFLESAVSEGGTSYEHPTD